MDDHCSVWLCKGINEIAERITEAATRPSVLFRPHVYNTGAEWCAMYGDNAKDGVRGFGATPAEAVAAFDAAWGKA